MQFGRSGAHPLGEDPFHQARDEMRSLIEILSAQRGWEEWKPSFGFAVALPDGAYERDAHPGAPAAVITCVLPRLDGEPQGSARGH
jgi:hypothetical protein